MSSKKFRDRQNGQADEIVLIRPYRPPLSFLKRIQSVLGNYWETFRSQLSDDPIDRCRWIRFPSSLKNISNKAKDQLGRAGEEEAVFFLREKGYTILQRNIRMPGVGEIDLVAGRDSILVFFEIKTRQNRKVGKPDEAVTTIRKRRLIAKAQEFLRYCKINDVSVRFDIISIVWPENHQPEIVHIENAFRINDCS